ncbi:MAG: tetratricopeptide repeat protein, partial [Candidatus Hydrogenedentes bacterium]|nr:tetratricopeptide repeat protein [Candidatus Hydrogenedentota bacterium]
MKLTELLSRLTGAFLRPALPVLLMLALAMAALAQETDEDTAFVQEYQHAVQLMSQGETLAAIELAEAGREKTKDLEDNCFFYIAWTGLLANLYDLEDRIDEARTLHKEAIGLCPECFEEDGMMACMPYSMAYGQMLSRQQEFVEAERVLIDMRKRLTSNDDVTPVIRAILDSDLANVEVSLGKYAEAVALLEPAAEIIRAALDGSEPDAYPKLLSNLGVALQNTGRLYEAEKVLTKSLERRRKVLGPEHHDYALTLMNLAMVKSDLGRYAEARSMFQEADQVFTNTLQYGPAHLKCIQNLAGVYMQQGEYAIAQERLEFLRANLAEAFGTATLDYAQVTNNLATLYSEVGRLSDAERLYREALRIVESVVGRNHPAYAAYLSNLAAFYQDLDRDEAALPLLQEAESVLETALGKDHPQYVKVLNDMGVSYIAMRRYDDARESLETVLKAQERIFGKDSSEDILPLSNLAEVYEAQGKLERALELEEHALKLAEEVHGRNHPDYVRRLSDTSAMMRTVGRKKDAAELLHEALHLSEAMPGNPQLRLTLLMNRMMCACEDGEIDVAERMAESWIAATRDYVGESMWGWSEESRKAFFEELDDSQVLLALLLNDRIPEEKRAALGLDASLLFKGLLLQIMAAERAVDQGLEDGAGRELARQLADLRQERAVLQNVALKRDEETRQGRLHEIARDIERCEGELAAMGEGSRDRSALLSADSRSLQKALPEDTVFIDFQEVRSIDWAGKRYTGTQLAAIVLNSGAKSCSLVMLGARQEVFAAVQAWHNMLRDQIAGVKAGSRSLGVKDEEALAALG